MILNSLRQAGGPTTAAERDLMRQLAYLSVGPRWPHPTLDDGGSLASLPMAVASGQLVESWLASDPAVSALQNEGFATEGGVVLPELIGGGALSPQPPPPSSTAVAPPGRVVEGRRRPPENGVDRCTPSASRAAPRANRTCRGKSLWRAIRIRGPPMITRMSEQFLNGTSAHNRPFQCHYMVLRLKTKYT